jgi:integrase
LYKANFASFSNWKFILGIALDWSEIALEDGFITVTADKAKTGSRRLVPIYQNLQAWLTPYFKKRGKVVPFENIPKQLGRLAKDTGMKWKKNALRHSFISYRLAEVQDTAKVALEAGNSPQMIFKHYRELVRPVEAKKWFAIEQADGFQGWRGHAEPRRTTNALD